ncbi:MAG: hypothetical protein ACRD0P_03140 [Stackebrandtia sp.]
MYEPNQNDDNVTPDNMVRSRFGTPRNGKNGSGPSKIPEQYRFGQAGTDQPGGDDLTIDGDFSSTPEQPPVRRPTTPPRRRYSANNDTGTTSVNGSRPQTPDAASDSAKAKRSSRAERRRAAEQSVGEDDYAATHSADLSRIASFLRSTQSDEPEAKPEPAPTPDPHAEEKTSELPTVTPDASAPPELTSEAVLTAVRQIPGVNGARLNEADNKLALDIADGADTDAVHRDVVAVLDSHLGVRARPAAPAVGAVEAEPARERPSPMQQSGRVMLERTQVITSGFESTVEVGLTVNGNRAMGRASGPAVDRHILRGAAEATVDAVGVLVGKDARVVVESASIENTGSCRVAVVVVLMLTQDGAEQLAGAAPVDADRRQAVVHATLQALNRRLESMLA